MKKIILSVGICVVVLVIAIAILQLSSNNADDRIAADIEEKATLEITETSNETRDVITVPTTNKAPISADAGGLTIGFENAPITILEFSSLSCPHCATFHRNTLPALKKDYIETGKVKFIFRDFPLNTPAMAASLLLKCIDVDKRYDFMDMLFEQQAAWAFDDKYQIKLQQYAALLGLSTEASTSCMTDKAAEEAMILTMRAGALEHGINSTPSFVILPSKEIVVGPQAYGVFSTKIEAILKDNE